MKIKDIAQALHLSPSTVSKALNGRFDISRETKDMVLEYAKEHGFVPSHEKLTHSTIRRICAIFDNYNSASIISPLLLAFSRHALNNNFEVIQTPISVISDYDQFMAKNNFDCSFIVGLSYKSPLLEQIKNTKFPTILYDSILNGEKVSTISSENIISVSKVIKELYKLGHTKIGFVTGDKNSFVSSERLAGYIIGLAEVNISYNADYVCFGGYTEENGVQAADFFSNKDVTAIVCSADIIAIGLMKGLELKGIKVPNQISVVGYDDLEIAKYVNPSLSTVKQDLDLISERAFQTLSAMLLNRPSQRIIVNSEIIMRDSIKKIN